MNLLEEKSKKAINFDLSDKKLQSYYPSKNYKKAWNDIKEYLLSNGFIHRQYSGYITKNFVVITDIINMVMDMSELFRWLQYCVKEFDVTIIGEEFSMKKYIGQDNTLE